MIRMHEPSRAHERRPDPGRVSSPRFIAPAELGGRAGDVMCLVLRFES
jgi:hypothetical protein